MAEIKISELSIGDWVMNLYANKPSRVIGLRTMYRDTYEIIAVSDDTQYMLIEDKELHNFEPIPLTPEILEKNGFVKKNYDNGKMWDWWCDNVLVRKFADEDIYRFIVVFNSNHYTTMMVVGKHTHELQHALRLAGVEKEIEV